MSLVSLCSGSLLFLIGTMGKIPSLHNHKCVQETTGILGHNRERIQSYWMLQASACICSVRVLCFQTWTWQHSYSSWSYTRLPMSIAVSLFKLSQEAFVIGWPVGGLDAHNSNLNTCGGASKSKKTEGERLVSICHVELEVILPPPVPK